MGVCSFWDDSFVPTPGTSVNANRNAGMAFLVYGSGTVTAIQFWKLSTDTGTHVGQLWAETGQVKLGEVTFTGETASGWQTAVFGTPIAVTAGQRYRACVSRPAQPYASHSVTLPTPNIGPMVMDYASVVNTGSLTAYPNTQNANHTYYVDVIADLAFDVRATQVLAEAWYQQVTGPVQASQVLAETWIRQVPPTEGHSSQVIAEAWVNATPPVVELRASQVLAEIWAAPVVSRTFWLSAQTI
jgi:Domain of unknown function (DUF4082)